MSRIGIEPLGEDALLLRLARRIDPAVNARVHALARRIEREAPPWLREVVPAYASLAVFVDGAHAGSDDGIDAVAQWLRALADTDADSEDDAVGVLPAVEIPVCYDRAFAPDLDEVAAQAGLARDEVVALHAGGDYRVAMIGFAPGFPYLLGLDPRLAVPRLARPRTRVPAGSVAIGGGQTGIYPRESPGGWRVIGRTPLRLFDAARTPPTLLQAGQRVRFVAIDAARFHALAGAGA
ncbi:inhibitor of KinA [Luteimonas sp. J16]|uniref:5-oxoprolinase subunit PxpB n=1 Tax=unclassified Luteimonas TaxID=2629088 RepID=UPI0004BA0707|nr:MULTISPECIES: 5-oxoprolinase subunit PxpB [unclassified Luteimonas]TWG88761.1 inhibitor of KinA [Luteimonas sp. J16]